MNEYDQFLVAINKWGDRNWINQYFDLLKRIFTHFNLTSDTPSLALTVTKNDELNVNIGHRYVSGLWGEERVGLIFPLDSDEAKFGCELHGYFKKQKKNEAKWVIFNWPANTSFPELLYHQWEQAVEAELERARKTPQKKRHSELFFATILDPELREQVLRDAYDRDSSV